MGYSEDHATKRWINAQELDWLCARRRALAGDASPLDPASLTQAEQDAVASSLQGLALSGGGIRSASYALGVLQAAAERGWLEQMDYLSTVSGGGYIGATTSLLLHRSQHRDRKTGQTRIDPPPPKPRAETFPLHFRCGQLPAKPDDGAESAAPDAYREPPALQALRDRADFLRGVNRDFFSSTAQALAGTLANLIFLFSVAALTIFALTFATSWIDAFGGPDAPWRETPATWVRAGWSVALGLWLLFYLSVAVGYVLILSVLRDPVGLREGFGKLSWAFTYPTVAIVLIVLLDRAAEVLDGGWSLLGSLAGLGALLGTVGRLASASSLLPSQAWQRLTQTLLLAVTPALGVLIFAILGGLVWAGPGQTDAVRTGVALDPPAWTEPLIERASPVIAWARSELATTAGLNPHEPVAHRATLLAGAGLGLFVLSCFIKLDAISPHPIYRNRLARTFFFRVRPPTSTGAGTTGQGERPASWRDNSVRELKLSQLCRINAPSVAPYPIINAALNLPGSRDERLRGRGAEVFTFTPDFIGSDRTNTCPTTAFEERHPEITLASAIAISGAAASSNMGERSNALTRFTLAVLNVRLGVWLVNPLLIQRRGKPRGGGLRTAQRWFGRLRKRYLHLVPRLFENRLPYLLREMFGSGNATSRMLNISDGGHIENMGAYELLQRRCRRIVLVDAEADPDMSFHGLAKLIRMARTDLSIDIELELDPLRPKVTQKDPFQRRCSRQQAVAGRIIYPERETPDGEFIYVKLSMTGRENPYIIHAAMEEPAFPHTPTANQFFDEARFEAYRALGYRAGRGAFAADQALPDDQPWRWREPSSDLPDRGNPPAAVPPEPGAQA